MKKILLILLVTRGMRACQNFDIDHPDFDYVAGYFPYQFPVRTLVLGDYIYDNSNDNDHKFVISIHFQLAPDSGSAILNRENLSVQSGFNKGWNVFVQTQLQPGLQLEEEEGWVSFKYTVKESRPAFKYLVEKESEKSTVSFVTLVVTYEKEVPEIQITRSIVESGKMEVEVIENGKSRLIGY